MEYRRRRPARSRGKKKGSSGGKTITLLILIAAGVYFVSISAVGTWLSETIVQPVFSAFMTDKESDNGDADDNNTDKTVSVDSNGEVALPGLECYLIQMGVFSTEANANVLAASLTEQGGGGFVMQDGEHYRVFTAGYPTEDEARAVKDALITDGYDCSVYELCSDTSTFSVSVMSGSDSTISDIQEIFYALLSAHDDLLELETAFDRDSMSVENGISSLKAIKDQLTKGLEGKTSLPKEITDCISIYETNLNKLINAENVSPTEFSSMVKYAQIAAACGFMDMISSLTV